MNQNFDAFLWIKPIKSSSNEIKFNSTEILWSFPEDITSLLKVFQNIPSFCFPDIEVAKLEKPQQTKSEYFIFTLTNDNGIRIFGICLRTLDGGIEQKYGINRRPKHCLCIITRNPYFAMFKTVLQQVSSFISFFTHFILHSFHYLSIYLLYSLLLHDFIRFIHFIYLIKHVVIQHIVVNVIF